MKNNLKEFFLNICYWALTIAVCMTVNTLCIIKRFFKELTMDNRKLSIWLKFIAVAMATVGIVLYFVFVPLVGMDMVDDGVMTKTAAWAFFAFLVPTAVPCYLVLIWLWNAAGDIRREASFTQKNAVRLKNTSIACLTDTGYLFVGNLAFFLAKSSPAVVFASFCFVVFTGIVLAVAAACLSHLVFKAAQMREENESFV